MPSEPQQTHKITPGPAAPLLNPSQPPRGASPHPATSRRAPVPHPAFPPRRGGRRTCRPPLGGTSPCPMPGQEPLCPPRDLRPFELRGDTRRNKGLAGRSGGALWENDPTLPPPAMTCEWSPAAALRLGCFVARGQGRGLPAPLGAESGSATGRAAPSNGQAGTTSHVFISFRCHPQGRPGHPPARVGTHLQLGRLHERQQLRRQPQCPCQLSPHACSSLKTGRSPSKLREPPKSS